MMKRSLDVWKFGRLLALARGLALLFCCLSLAAGAPAEPLAFRWAPELSRAEPYEAQAFHGETFRLAATPRQYGQALTGLDAAAKLYWQTPGMEPTKWYVAPGEYDPITGTLTATWTPAMDVGGDRVSFFLALEQGDAVAYRVHGRLRLAPSPGFNPAELVPEDVRQELVEAIAAEVKGWADGRYAAQTALDAETSARQTADATLQAGIDTEALARARGDEATLGAAKAWAAPKTHSHTQGEIAALGADLDIIRADVASASARAAASLYASGIQYGEGEGKYTGDLNALTRGGVYYVTAAASNRPEVDVGGVVLVAHPDDDTWVAQTFIATGAASTDPNNQGIYQRAHTGGAWTAWKAANHARIGAVGLEVTSSGYLRAKVDTAMPAAPEDTRMPSTKLLKTLLDASAYTLPAATATTLGGVKVGKGLEVDGNGKLGVATGTGLGVDYDGKLRLSEGGAENVYTLGALRVDFPTIVEDNLYMFGSGRGDCWLATTNWVGKVVANAAGGGDTEVYAYEGRFYVQGEGESGERQIVLADDLLDGTIHLFSQRKSNGAWVEDTDAMNTRLATQAYVDDHAAVGDSLSVINEQAGWTGLLVNDGQFPFLAGTYLADVEPCNAFAVRRNEKDNDGVPGVYLNYQWYPITADLFADKSYTLPAATDSTPGGVKVGAQSTSHGGTATAEVVTTIDENGYLNVNLAEGLAYGGPMGQYIVIDTAWLDAYAAQKGWVSAEAFAAVTNRLATLEAKVQALEAVQEAAP